MQREVALPLLNRLPEDELKKIIDKIEPLEFGQLHTNEYFRSMFNYHTGRSVMDEMEYLYEENKIKHKRVGDVMAIGSNINFNFLEYFDEESDDDK